MKNSFDLTGKIALVTGCKRGIGMAMALGLAEAGADIIGVSANLELAGSNIEKAVTGLGRQFKAYQADFSNRDSLYAFIKQLKADYPRIDILVNNAGIAAFGTFNEIILIWIFSFIFKIIGGFA